MVVCARPPLVERLGQEFFRKIPNQPGVYSMRDATGAVVYVGKAKKPSEPVEQLSRANPERVSRRHLRLLREVTRIDFDLCHTESAALEPRNKAPPRAKAKFNRAECGPARRNS